jgi:hypothetical protein
MRKNYFAKSDMPQVNSFYKNIWDKLTDDGKGEISHRLWEGIRHGEKKFSELVDDIKEKEAKRIYELLLKHDDVSVQSTKIPEADRQEFIRAIEGGNKAEAYQILDRQSFTNNVSVAPSREIKSEMAQSGREADSKEILSATVNRSEKARPDDVEELPSISDLNLKDLKIADASTQGVAANSIRSDMAPKRSL